MTTSFDSEELVNQRATASPLSLGKLDSRMRQEIEARRKMEMLERKMDRNFDRVISMIQHGDTRIQGKETFHNSNLSPSRRTSQVRFTSSESSRSDRQNNSLVANRVKQQEFIDVPIFTGVKDDMISSSPLPIPPSFSLLPYEITESFLARVPRSYYPKLSLVSKTFRSILSSPELYKARSRLGSTQQCLYVYLQSYNSSPNGYHHWNTLSINPSQTKMKNKIVPIPSSNFANPTVVGVGFDIYVIGGNYSACSNIVKVLDCRSHTWRDAPCMRVARQDPTSCVYDGKIYVFHGFIRWISGDNRLPSGEVFDITTQTWEDLPEPGFEIPKCNKMEEFKGKIYFANNYMMYASYDPKQKKWEKKSGAFASSDCVMDNVTYFFLTKNDGRSNFWWRDINGGEIKEVKGLDLLGNRHKEQDGSSIMTKVTGCGGKLYVMWQRYTKQNDMVNIWCAEISVEKRDGDEIWGNIEWLDVIHTVPKLCSVLHFLAISI